MLHLIAFDSLDSDIARACLRQYREGDLCVFADLGHFVATDFPLRGPAYLLAGEGLLEREGLLKADRPLPESSTTLATIDYDQLIVLMTEQDSVINWYP